MTPRPSPLAPRPLRLTPWAFRLLPFAFCFLSPLAYLLASRTGGFLGFPLDDAWIHQTYARNLAQLGQWAFIPGQPSAGSTSPLWTVLLALGYGARIEYHVWTYALGVALLAANAWLAQKLTLSLWPERPLAAWLAAMFVALEWHLAWASVSGMETLLFSAMVLAAFVIPPRRAGWLGAVVGVSILARPDGLTLLPFVLARVMLSAPTFSFRANFPVLKSLLGFALFFLPYLAFNHSLSGAWWPNTFAAKQAEYAVMRSAPLLARLWRVSQSPFVGGVALLVPGLAAVLWAGRRRAGWAALLPLLWAGAFIAAYVLRLPVAYQHGRYVMPVIPVLVALGVGGLSTVLRMKSAAFLPRVASRAWVLASAAVLLAFWVIGAGAYTRDVQFIESEMVATARWVNQHTPPTALIAAHDIGAVGYFGGQPLLDLAGLVSPEVIPFIRDEARLREWLNTRRADYLIIFPDWYSAQMRPTSAELLFQTDASYGPQQGTTNMGVYRWPPALP